MESELKRKDDIIDAGYDIWNAKIVRASLRCHHNTGSPYIYMDVTGEGIGCSLNIELNYHGIECVKCLLDITEKSDLFDISGSYIRVASKDHILRIIGHICNDIWFRVYDG